MVARQNLELLCTFVRETDKILYDIQQTFLFKDALKKGIKLSILRIFVATVLRLPLHKAVFTGSDRTSLRGHKVTHNADAVIDKHGWNLMHVIPNL